MDDRLAVLDSERRVDRRFRRRAEQRGDAGDGGRVIDTDREPVALRYRAQPRRDVRGRQRLRLTADRDSERPLRERGRVVRDLLRLRVGEARRKRSHADVHLDRLARRAARRGGDERVRELLGIDATTRFARDDLNGASVRRRDRRFDRVDVRCAFECAHPVRRGRAIDGVRRCDVLRREQGADPGEGAEERVALLPSAHDRIHGRGLVDAQAEGFRSGVIGRCRRDHVHGEDLRVSGLPVDLCRERLTGVATDVVARERHVARHPSVVLAGVEAPCGEQHDHDRDGHPDEERAPPAAA
jgi:hypothetical protein